MNDMIVKFIKKEDHTAYLMVVIKEVEKYNICLTLENAFYG